MKSVVLVTPRSITPAVCAAFVAFYILITAAPFVHAATAPAPAALTPKQMQTVQMLLDTYGVPKDKIQAVTAVLVGPRRQEGSATSTSPREQMMGGPNASSTQPGMDGEQGSSTRPMMPPLPPSPASGGPQSAAGSVLQFVADYSDAFNQNMAAVATAPYQVVAPMVRNYFSLFGFK